MREEIKKEIKEEIAKLTERYNSLKKSKSDKEMEGISEANIRANFIDDLFGILGWDIKNPDEYDRENYVRRVGHADVALKLNKEPIVFIEAKRFGAIPFVDRDTTDWIEEERQVMNYAASPERKIKWAVLTNFEKLRVFNALNGTLIISFEAPWDYTEKLDWLLYLTKDSIESGRINSLETRKEMPDIDYGFLQLLNDWRLSLANSIYEKNKDNNVLKDEKGKICLEKLKSVVQRILDRLIIVRYAEDRLILDNPDQLKSLYESWQSTKAYTSLNDLVKNFFVGFDKIHNSMIFEKGHICENVKISDDLLGEIINDLYNINFRKFDFDILGNTYETYLGNTLFINEKGRLELKPSQETRKKSGIYYTPPYVVDYIVKNTLGELLKNKKPEEVSKIKVLDPACGSGSFLIKAFDYFKDYYEKENEKTRKEREERIKELLKSERNQLKISEEVSNYDEMAEFEKKILKENIYGVDLDGQAAEIASVNLMLKALKPKEKLPLILGENIKVGNSLISGTEEELKKYFGDNWKEKRPFNWEDELKDVFSPNLSEDKRGFDVVIGNPPYGATLDGNEKKFFRENYAIFKGNYDTYNFFISRSILMLKNGGYLGLIVPNTFLANLFAKKLRKEILSHFTIRRIVDLKNIKVFPEATVSSCLIFLKLESNESERISNVIKIFNGTLKSGIFKIYHRGNISQRFWMEDQEYVFNIYVDNNILQLYDKIVTQSKTVDEIGDTVFGVKIYQVGKGKPLQTKDDFDNKVYTSNFQKDTAYKKLIIGNDVGRYALHWKDNWISYGPWLAEPRTSRYFDNQKIVIQQVTGGLTKRINATYVEEPYVTKNTTSVIIQKDENYNLRYLLSLINSKLMTFYHKNFSSNAQKEAFPKVNSKDVKQFPIKTATPKQQKPFIELTDKMLSLNKQLNSINIDFDRYVNTKSRISDIYLKSYVEELDVNDKEVLNDANRIEGKIMEFEITEEGEWLVFKVGYERKTKEGKLYKVKIRAFKCKFTDEKLRKFLYYSIKNYTRAGTLGKGNLYERILKIKIPHFDPNSEKNLKIIYEITEPYLKVVDEYNKIKGEIEENDKTIDQKVYELYGLTKEEIKIVEENAGGNGLR